MKYLKLNINTTKEQFKPIEIKINELGLINEIDFNSIKEGYIYIYRDISNKVCNFIVPPHRFNRQIKDNEDYGKEITLEEFLKL